MAETGERHGEPRLYRLQGMLLMTLARRQAGADRRRALVAAEQSLLRSLAVARRQRAKLSELRTVLSLVTLWRRGGNRPMVELLLRETYEWFTEGLDTPDLRAARAALGTLTARRSHAANGREDRPRAAPTGAGG